MKKFNYLKGYNIEQTTDEIPVGFVGGGSQGHNMPNYGEIINRLKLDDTGHLDRNEVLKGAHDAFLKMKMEEEEEDLEPLRFNPDINYIKK